jgi:hypothetical protein
MHKLKYKLTLLLLFVFGFVGLSATAQAAVPVECADGYRSTAPTGAQADAICADHKTGSSAADSEEANEPQDPGRGGNLEADCEVDAGESLTTENCGIVAYVVLFTNVLSGIVGIVIVIMIAVGGIQYTAARDDPQAVAAAKTRIRNAILALIFYLFAFAFLQWLVPGGIF